jgi:hypothetical protein
MNQITDTKKYSQSIAALNQDPEKVALLQLAAKPTDEGRETLATIIYDMTEPIRSGELDEDTISDIYLRTAIPAGTIIDYPIDFYQSSDRDKFWAYTIPDVGYLPQRHASAGSVKVNTYRSGNAIDVYYSYLEQARWDILQRSMEVFQNGFVKKLNHDGWACLLGTAAYRNVLVSDASAPASTITPRLISLMQVFMKRNGGGNLQSNGYRLTDLYFSPEAIASMRTWDASLVPEAFRERMFSAGAGLPISNLFGINFNEHIDFGVGQPMQQMLVTPEPEGGLGVVLPPGTEELCLGMDRTNTKNWAKAPYTVPKGGSSPLDYFIDDSSYTRRSQVFGIVGMMNCGFVCLESSTLLLGVF